MKKEQVEQITKAAADAGLLIEAGWLGLRHGVMAADCPPMQVADMRMAFFAGAQHLFSSMLAMLDPGAEPTENDMKKMDLIERELRKFSEDLLKQLRTQGRKQ